MNIKKALKVGVLGLATIAGTYSSHERDFPPFFVRKVGTSAGICVGLSVKLEEGAKFYGPVVSLFSGNRGKVNGANISLMNWGLGGAVNGLELSGINFPQSETGHTYEGPYRTPNNVNGVQAGLINCANNVNGVQIGVILNLAGEKINGFQGGILANLAAEDSKSMQVAVYNQIYDSYTGKGQKRGCLVNYHFGSAEGK